MEKYFKMSDVFWGAKPEDFHINPVCIHENFDDGVTPHNHAIHAINSHDELVEMNKELLAALECAEGFVYEVSEKTGFGQVHTLKVIRSAIAKAKAAA